MTRRRMPRVLHVTWDRRYGYWHTHETKAAAVREVRRAPHEIDYFEYVPRKRTNAARNK